MGGAQGRGLWHWGAAKGWSLADAELPAMTDGPVGLDPVVQGGLCALGLAVSREVPLHRGGML